MRALLMTATDEVVTEFAAEPVVNCSVVNYKERTFVFVGVAGALIFKECNAFTLLDGMLN
jgi:hypothetical protein